MIWSGRRLAVAGVLVVGAVVTAGVAALTGGRESPSRQSRGHEAKRSESTGRSSSKHSRPSDRDRAETGDVRRAPRPASRPAPPAPRRPTPERTRAIRREAERSIRESPTLRDAPPEVRRRLLRAQARHQGEQP
jgi:hypothetical protein